MKCVIKTKPNKAKKAKNRNPMETEKQGENSAAKERTSRENEGTLQCDLIKDLKNKKH